MRDWEKSPGRWIPLPGARRLCPALVVSCLILGLAACQAAGGRNETPQDSLAGAGTGSGCERSEPLEPGEALQSVQVDGAERSYLVYVPQGYSGGEPAAVVLAYHGGGADAALQVRRSRINPLADEHGFLVVYPEGTRGLVGEWQTWNAGDCCGRAQRLNVDDVAFTRAIIADLDRKYCIDRERIFATGISNGGMMAYRLACELSDEIAAVAPVAATLAVEPCNPGRPVPVLHFHGTADDILPFTGGESANPLAGGTDFRSVEDVISFWAAQNGCRGTPEIVYDHGDAVCRSFSPCDQGADVVLCTIEGGGHTWPGGEPVELFGKTSQDISASQMMWDFFQDHPLP